MRKTWRLPWPRRRMRRLSGPMNPGIALSPGVGRYDWRDPYHVAMALPWPLFLALTLGLFLLVNLAFAALYRLQPASVANVGSLAEAFFFSVQTFATVGYGVMSPQTIYGHLVSTVEIFSGMLSVAVMAGVMFGRFSRPHSRVGFARNLVIGPVEGVRSLSARVVNRRFNPVYDVESRMVLVTRRRAEGNHSTWQIRDLPLLRDRYMVAMMTWTVTHAIDAASPLYGLDADDLARAQAQVMLSVTATEGTTLAPVHAMHLFHAADILFDHEFVDLIAEDEAGHPRFDIHRADEVVRLAPTPAPDRPGG